MKLYEYNHLNEIHQLQLLKDCGVFLASYTANNDTYALYQVDGFYVEIKCIKKDSSIVGLRSFKTTCLLDPYLDNIQIPL